MLKFGINFVPLQTPSKFIESVKLLEESGFDYAWVADSHIIWKDVYAFMTLCAVNTSRVKIGPCVTNPVTRHPTVAASAMSTINEISGGRAIIGLGRGDSAVRTLGHQPATLKEFKESIKLIKQLCAGQEADYQGKPVRIRWTGAHIPIYIAAYGPKVLTLTGQMADGVILQIGHPELIKWFSGFVRKGAEEAGRDFSQIDVVAAAATYVSYNMAEAREKVRYFPADVHNHVADLISRYPKSYFPADLTKDIELRKGHDYSRHAERGVEHANYVSDELIDKYTFIGPPEALLDKMHALQDAGVNQVCLYLKAEEMEYVIRTFGEKIIPHFK